MSECEVEICPLFNRFSIVICRGMTLCGTVDVEISDYYVCTSLWPTAGSANGSVGGLYTECTTTLDIPIVISSTVCCCPPTPMTLASGGSPMFPVVVHQPASPSIWPSVQSLRRGLSTNPGATMWCACGAVEEMMCVVCVDVTEGA